MPKAALIPHERLKAFTMALSGVYGVTSKDNVYIALPLYHSSGGLFGVAAIFTVSTL